MDKEKERDEKEESVERDESEHLFSGTESVRHRRVAIRDSNTLYGNGI